MVSTLNCLVASLPRFTGTWPFSGKSLKPDRPEFRKRVSGLIHFSYLTIDRVIWQLETVAGLQKKNPPMLPKQRGISLFKLSDERATPQQSGAVLREAPLRDPVTDKTQ